MKSTYQTNIEAFELRYSKKIDELFIQEWKDYTDKEISIRSNPIGFPNIYFTHSGSPHSLFNDTNPYQDIKD